MPSVPHLRINSTRSENRPAHKSWPVLSSTFHNEKQTMCAANKKARVFRLSPVLALPIFPGRRQPSIVSRNELNCRVRNGNGWTLALISTNSMSSGLAGEQTVLYCISLPLSRTFALEKSGDPYRIRTDVNGVRGRCLNHLTNGPWCTFTDSNRGPTD